MKLRIKIKELSMTLCLTVDDPESTVAALKARIADEVQQRIGLRIVQCQLSLNGRDPLSESVQEVGLSELGLVAGDLLHVLDAEFDPPLTQRVPDAAPERQSLTVEPTPPPPPPAETPPPEVAAEPAPAAQQEPLLMRHARPGRLPRLLSWLAEQEPVESADHLLALALHALMLEAGLQPQQAEAPASSAETATASTSAAGSDHHEPAGERTAGYFPGGPAAPRRWGLPSGWRRAGIFQLTYGLHFNMALSAVLTVVPMGNVTVAHAVPAGGAEIFSATLRPRDYIAPAAPAAADRFRNLRQLSNAFKNGVTVPLLVHLQRAAGLVSPHEWRALPLELQLEILRRLRVSDLLTMRRTSKEMRARADDPLLWKDLLFRDFPAEAAALAGLEPGADWKALYVETYQRRAAARRQAEQPWPDLPLPPFPPAHPRNWFDPPGIPPPPIAGIIGGEYDRLPNLGFPPVLGLPRSRLDGVLPRLPPGSRPPPGPFGGGGTGFI